MIRRPPARGAARHVDRPGAAWAADLHRLPFHQPVHAVYNPLVYARGMYERYLERFAHPGVTALLLGMNPGPWGMAQTGVPFGEVAMVRDWLRLDETIGRPEVEHPARPVRGLDCPRHEVSGLRLWGWARDRFGTPQRFFRRFFVANYCPLAFLADSGRNLTPDRLPATQRDALFERCDDALRALVAWMRPQWVIGVGGFAEDRARGALEGCPVRIGRVLHPSPASPSANRDWAGQVTRQLADLGIPV